MGVIFFYTKSYFEKLFLDIW